MNSSRSSPESTGLRSAKHSSEGAIVFAHACRPGPEGIVSKRLGGVYSSGRCRNWLKVKNPEFQRR